MPEHALAQLPAPAAILVVTLCGAAVLAVFDVWLRRKEVRDPAFLWLCLSLLSWSAGSAWQLLVPDSLGASARARLLDQIPYLLSPVSSALFTITAFRLCRVRELFRRPDLRAWPAAVVLFVIALSLAGYVLSLAGQRLAGGTVDATASAVALATLGAGLSYSFYRYGNQYLVALTGVTITWLIARQFIGASLGPLHGALAAIGIAGDTTLTMLFVALAVAWGLSDTSRMKPVGAPTDVSVAALFFDLRGSTAWSVEVLGGDFRYVGTFLDELREWALAKASELPCGRPDHVKFLGDGFLVVWEVSDDRRPPELVPAVAHLACTLVGDYPAWATANRALWRDVPAALGAGLDAGSAMRLTFENGSEDYVGAPLNLASKMQALARPCGGVVIQGATWQRLDPALRERFPERGAMRIGSGGAVELRATVEVDLPDGVPPATAVVTAEAVQESAL